MRRFLLLLLFCVCAHHSHAATITNLQGTEVTWHSGTASLASNSQVQSATVSLGANAGHLHAWCTLAIPSTSVAVTANTAVVVWFRVSTDGGTTFPDGSATVTPAELPHMTFPLRPISTAQVVSAHVQTMPVGVFQVTIRNEGTGATINTTWTLKCRTYTEQIN